jgi:hypothetical protein
MSTVPVTQALWTHVMGADANPSAHQGPDLPLENVSWDEITRDGGFLDVRGLQVAMDDPSSLLGNAKDCYRSEDLAAATNAASSASRFSRPSAWMENIQALSTLPHSIP